MGVLNISRLLYQCELFLFCVSVLQIFVVMSTLDAGVILEIHDEIGRDKFNSQKTL